MDYTVWESDKNPTNWTARSRRLETAHKGLKWTMWFKRKGATKGPNGPEGYSEIMRIQNPAAKLDHAKREIVAARFFEVSAEAIVQAAVSREGS